MAGHGGRRPGAGRKPGTVSKARRLIGEMAREHAEVALTVLVDVAVNGKSEAARVAAANALLDRGFGRPQAPELQPSPGAQIVPITADMTANEAADAYLRMIDAS